MDDHIPRDEPDMPAGDPVDIPIDGVLDLHMFNPKEIRQLVPDYIDLCRERGILTVRIIHGKGIGVQREIVHKILERHRAVVSFGHPGDGGSWGATVAELAPPGTPPHESPTARPGEEV